MIDEFQLSAKAAPKFCPDSPLPIARLVAAMRRDKFLSETLHRSLAYARELIIAWVSDDNTARVHSVLGYQTPAGFVLHLTTAISRPAARDESSARRKIAQTAPKGVNAAGLRFGWVKVQWQVMPEEACARTPARLRTKVAMAR